MSESSDPVAGVTVQLVGERRRFAGVRRLLNYYANYADGMNLWRSRLELAYGMATTDSRLDLFSNYLRKPRNIDVSWSVF